MASFGEGDGDSSSFQLYSVKYILISVFGSIIVYSSSLEVLI